MSYCLVVPHFNHVDAFEKFLPTLVSLNLPCIVVDDGSTDEVKQRLESLLVQYPQIHFCLLYTSPSPRDLSTSRMPSSA